MKNEVVIVPVLGQLDGAGKPEVGLGMAEHLCQWPLGPPHDHSWLERSCMILHGAQFLDPMGFGRYTDIRDGIC